MSRSIRRYTLGVSCAVVALVWACAATKPTVPPPGPVPPEPAPVLVEPPPPEVKPEPPPPPAPEPQQTELNRLLLQSESVRRMPAADAAKELEQARQAFGRSKTDYNRLLYAVLLLLPSAGGPDDAKAGALLEPMLKDRGSNGLRAFAAFLHFQIAENRKTEERMRDEQKRADALQEKLDALKEVEKNLLDREQPSPRKK
jgi:hypothetical protein